MSPRRILVVDDEPMLALDIACEIGKAGYEVVGPAGSVSAALSLIADLGCDAAILDVNLGRETAAPIAVELRERGIPFIIVSGYARTQQPPLFADAPFLSKPICSSELLTALAEV